MQTDDGVVDDDGVYRIYSDYVWTYDHYVTRDIVEDLLTNGCVTFSRFPLERNPAAPRGLNEMDEIEQACRRRGATD
jgi:hypothetical protein